jgi:hypothetical protein
MQKKNFSLLFLTGALMLFLSSCSSISVTSDYDKTVDFTQFKTYEYYGWADESDKILNDIDKRRIEQAVEAEFGKRGMQLVKGNGDLVVTLFIVVQEKTEQRATTTGAGAYGGYYGGYYGYGPGWGWGPSYSTTTVSTYDYNVGTLVVDVFDKANEKLIWEGAGQGTIEENPQNRDKTIPKAVSKIMYNYPVRPIPEKKK